MLLLYFKTEMTHVYHCLPDALLTCTETLSLDRVVVWLASSLVIKDGFFFWWTTVFGLNYIFVGFFFLFGF